MKNKSSLYNKHTRKAALKNIEQNKIEKKKKLEKKKIREEFKNAPLIRLSIVWLRSKETGKKFPRLLLHADTDMATDGLAELVSIERKDIVLTELNDEEYPLENEGMCENFEKRINKELNRSDLKAIYLKRIIEGSELFERSVLIYQDIYSENGEATEENEITLEEYNDLGGKIIYHNVEIT